MTISVVNPREPVDYSSTATPSSYVCGNCKKSGVKLWRDYETFLQNQTLRCADCAAREADVDISTMNDDGSRLEDGRRCVEIEWRIPAIPTAENDTFWGYTSSPLASREWWARLPVR